MIKFIKKLFEERNILSYSYNESNEMLTVNYSNWDIEKYIWSCTVWHTYPDFNRCRISKELFLSNIWTKIKWEEKNLI